MLTCFDYSKSVGNVDVDKSTLWRWAKAGYLIPIKIGTKTRYRRSDVQKLLSGRVEHGLCNYTY